MHKIVKRLVVVLMVLGGLVLGGAAGGVLWFRARLAASLPRLDGEARVAGLSAPATVERDAAGAPTVRGADRFDVARALGFLHGQDRFFQMDLLRRTAAGELAQLVGAPMLETDRRARLHRFRTRAERNLQGATARGRGLLVAYAEGVNAGLAALGERPPEYLVLRSEPAVWRPEDSVLVLFAMYMDLQLDDGRRESALGVLHDALPAALYRFLAPGDSVGKRR